MVIWFFPILAAQVEPVVLKLEMIPQVIHMDFLRANNVGYMPSGMALVKDKPAAIQKEPSYTGTVQYGAFQVGNGPRSITYFAVEDQADHKGRVLIDFNQNRDLTDDGDGAWSKTSENQGMTFFETVVNIRASWGSPVSEESTADYGLMLYRRHGDDRLNWVRLAAREGKWELGGKSRNILLAENSNDGIYTIPKAGDRTRRPVTLFVDLDGDGFYRGFSAKQGVETVYTPERFSLERPFQVEGKWWEAFPSISGGELTIVPSQPPSAATEGKQAPSVEKQLLKPGTMAPDFVAKSPAGKDIRLSSFKGKVVLLDFWATWCGPCLQSMPEVEKLYQKVKSQKVVVLSLNVFDAKGPFDDWIKKNAGDYSFTFAFDPAGKDSSKSIAASKFNVTAIPTVYVMDRKGKIIEVIVGSGNEKALIAALKKAGLTIKD